MDEKQKKAIDEEYARALLEMSKKSVESKYEPSLGESLSEPARRLSITGLENPAKAFGNIFKLDRLRLVVLSLVVIIALILVILSEI